MKTFYRSVSDLRIIVELFISIPMGLGCSMIYKKMTQIIIFYGFKNMRGGGRFAISFNRLYSSSAFLAFALVCRSTGRQSLRFLAGRFCHNTFQRTPSANMYKGKSFPFLFLFLRTTCSYASTYFAVPSVLTCAYPACSREHAGKSVSCSSPQCYMGFLLV